MALDKFHVFSIVVLIAFAGLVLSYKAGATFALTLPFDGQPPTAPQGDTGIGKAPDTVPPANFPQEVWNAIRNRQDEVEVPVTNEISKIFFIDFKGPVHTGTGTDCGPDSGSSRKIRGGIKWTSFPVNYQIDASASGIDLATAKQAVVNAFNTWDAEEHPAGTFFTEASPAKVNVGWASIDGSGGTLAVASITYNIITKAIITSTVIYDAGDSWAVFGALNCSSQGSGFDIEDVGAHEIGHVIGLAHVSKSNDVALTMYPFASQGETLKRTLGTGDKKGIDALY